MQELTLPEDCAEKNSSFMQRRRMKDLREAGGGGGEEEWGTGKKNLGE